MLRRNSVSIFTETSKCNIWKTLYRTSKFLKFLFYSKRQEFSESHMKNELTMTVIFVQNIDHVDLKRWFNTFPKYLENLLRDSEFSSRHRQQFLNLGSKLCRQWNHAHGCIHHRNLQKSSLWFLRPFLRSSVQETTEEVLFSYGTLFWIQYKSSFQ